MRAMAWKTSLDDQVFFTGGYLLVSQILSYKKPEMKKFDAGWELRVISIVESFTGQLYRVRQVSGTCDQIGISE